MPRPSARLPLLLSLLVHGIFVFLLYALTESASPSTRPSVEAVGLANPGAGHLTLVTLPGPVRKPSSKKAAAAEASPREMEAQVIDPPLYPSQTVPESPSSLRPAGKDGNAGGDEREGSPRKGSEGGGGSGNGSSLFAAGASAKTVVYVVDCSVSMGLNHALDRAKDELLASLNSLPATTRFQVILYNRDADPLRINGQMNLLHVNSDVLRQVTEKVMAQRATGGTDHFKALSRGLVFHPEALYLVTDADDLEPIVVQRITQMNRGRTVIHAIELNNRKAERLDSPLRQLAASNGGTYRHVNPETGAERRELKPARSASDGSYEPVAGAPGW
jgi:hypothetical protein